MHVSPVVQLLIRLADLKVVTVMSECETWIIPGWRLVWGHKALAGKLG